MSAEIISEKFESWLGRLRDSEDEKNIIRRRAERFKKFKFRYGRSMETHTPNNLNIKDSDGEYIHFPLYLRSCPCEKCVHPDNTQYWCYKQDCSCCQDSCT